MWFHTLTLLLKKAAIKKTLYVLILQFFRATDIFVSPLVEPVVPEKGFKWKKIVLILHYFWNSSAIICPIFEPPGDTFCEVKPTFKIITVDKVQQITSHSESYDSL